MKGSNRLKGENSDDDYKKDPCNIQYCSTAADPDTNTDAGCFCRRGFRLHIQP